LNRVDLHLYRPAASESWRHVHVNLSTGSIDADGKVTSLTGIFSQLRVGTDRALKLTIIGTDGDDRLIAHGGSHPVFEHGRAGQDFLRTSRGNDSIWGGEGTDKAIARFGDDNCYSVEIARDCETSTP
jgi:hypothetical protein